MGGMSAVIQACLWAASQVCDCLAMEAKRMKPIKRTKHFELGTDSKKGLGRSRVHAGPFQQITRRRLELGDVHCEAGGFWMNP